MSDLELLVRLLTIVAAVVGLCLPAVYCLGYWAGRRAEGVDLQRLIEMADPYPGTPPAGIHHPDQRVHP